MTDTNLYEEYATLKIKIREMETRLKELEPTLLLEVIDTKDPVSNQWGKFTTRTRVSYVYSSELSSKEQTLQEQLASEAKDRLDEIEVLKQHEIKTGWPTRRNSIR